MQTEFPLVSLDPRVQAFYEEMRRDGTGHNLAEMFALQTPPQISGTDAIFLEGHCNGRQFEQTPWLGDGYRRVAADAGVDTTGKVYLGGLAAYPGDPQAWVSGRSDVERVCAERGWGCRGAVNVKAREPEAPPAPGPAVADDIVEGMVADIVEAQVDPRDAACVDVQDLREQVVDRLKPHWADAAT